MSYLAKKRWLIILPVGAILTMLILAKFKSQPQLKTTPPAAPLVATQTVELKSISPFVVGYGRARPKETWSAQSEVSGRVIFRHEKLEKGEVLPAGTELLRIDPVDYELKLSQAKSDLSSAKAELTRTELNESKLILLQKLEQQQLLILQAELERVTGLLKSGATSQSTVDKEQRNVLVQQQKLLDVENSIKQFPSDLEVAKSKVALADSRLQEAQRKLDKTRVVLPFDARISSVDIERQQVVNEGQFLVMAHRLGTMEIPVQVSLLDMRNFASFLAIKPRSDNKFPDIKTLGLDAEITLYVDQVAYRWPGKLVNVGESIDPQGNSVTLVVDVSADLEKFDPAKRPPIINEMYVQVKVSGNETHLPVIPADAVHGKNVFVLNSENQLNIKSVILAFEQQGQVAVLNGIEAGETLILSDVIPAIEGIELRTNGAEK